MIKLKIKYDFFRKPFFNSMEKQSYQLHYHLSKATKYIVCFNNAISKNIIAEIQIQNLFQN